MIFTEPTLGIEGHNHLIIFPPRKKATARGAAYHGNQNMPLTFPLLKPSDDGTISVIIRSQILL